MDKIRASRWVEANAKSGGRINNCTICRMYLKYFLFAVTSLMILATLLFYGNMNNRSAQADLTRPAQADLTRPAQADLIRQKNVEPSDFVLSRKRRSDGSVEVIEDSPSATDSTNHRQVNFPTSGVAIYTRWGRKSCPSETDLLYRGVAGGSFYQKHGGGSNYLCLPMDPIWDKYDEGVEKGSKIFGAEYEAPTGFSWTNSGGVSTQDHNVPCVVCQSQTRHAIFMIPARNLCYDGWHLEYSGFLMSAHPEHHGKTEFICMDSSPESDPAGYRDENGALFYNAEAVCGSLPCPPYVQRREITCAVCTR